ncbi:MAG: restriction endonuclease subunit S [Bacteroidales bacterium]|jgi:restriction endonuclease S subunit|nr:restriction endonuclease subunit S [Bacteroidales bacterium]MCI1785834.1 restriction endonuclease subunit S [Bacteroidales bacterium]
MKTVENGQLKVENAKPKGGVRSLPKGWERKKLGDVCDIINGSTPLRSNKEYWDDGDFPWFTIDDIKEQGRIITNTKQKVTNKALNKLRVLPMCVH